MNIHSGELASGNSTNKKYIQIYAWISLIFLCLVPCSRSGWHLAMWLEVLVQMSHRDFGSTPVLTLQCSPGRGDAVSLAVPISDTLKQDPFCQLWVGCPIGSPMDINLLSCLAFPLSEKMFICYWIVCIRSHCTSRALFISLFHTLGNFKVGKLYSSVCFLNAWANMMQQLHIYH